VAYEVHLDVFDGPFSLLLQLITAEQVEIYEVHLADIVNGFLAEMARAKTVDLEVSTEFLLIAATLVELKCRRLLPGPDGSDLEEELAWYEARDYLLARLVECKTFASAAAVLDSAEQAAGRSVPRRAGADERFCAVVPDLLAGVTAERLAEVAARALAPRPAAVIGDAHVLADEVSITATIEELAAQLRARGAASFRELTARLPSTAHVVAYFLALLELYKEERVELEQRSTFGALQVRWTGGGVPEPAAPRGRGRESAKEHTP
jgi:segregation and condensation protein A